jgi:nucleoside transporter
MAASTTPLSPAPPVPLGLRIQLSVMMFLQFAIWGAWFTVLGNRLGALGLSSGAIGSIYGTMALGAVFSPMFIGQIADRYFASEKLMALLHLAGAGFLYWMSVIPAATPGQESTTAWLFWSVALGYALIYTPTLALSNSIAFTHLPDGTRDFPSIRVLGTIGWIAAGLAVGKLLVYAYEDPKVSPGPFQLAAVLSVILGVYSLLLPHTPPLGKPGDALPFLRAVGLLKDPSFAVFFGASFLITIVLAFYYNYTGVFLEQKIGVKDVASTMTIGQVSEMVILPFLPLFLYYMGMKWVLALGMLAWGVRYLIFAFGTPELFPLVVLGVALHGICFDFFFAAGFIHVDKEAPNEIRGSAQALFTFLTYGVGMWVGSEFSGVMASQYLPTGGTPDWQTFWLVPGAGVLIALSIFVLGFRMKSRNAA